MWDLIVSVPDHCFYLFTFYCMSDINVPDNNHE